MYLDGLVQNVLDWLRLQDSLGSQLILVLIRAIGIIIPPIQGWFFDLVGISLFGPVKAFLVAEAGLLIGASSAFGIARKFREPLLNRFVSIQKIHLWENALTKQEQFWSWVLLRLPSNIFFDYISYAAGLTNCTYHMFIVSTFLGSLPSMLLFFIITSYAYKNGGWAYGLVAAFGLLFLGHIVYKVYKREKTKTI
jgi:uncharacterized membrane protein YdjX (TVP38/TMEM64 family)